MLKYNGKLRQYAVVQTQLFLGGVFAFMKTFKGGVHAPDNKALTAQCPIEQMPLVPDYYVALSQHIGKPAEAVVAAGEKVAEGQLIAKATGKVSANIFSPVSGEVVGIEQIVNAKGGKGDYIHIKSDGEQRVVTLSALENPTAEQIVQRIEEAGIVGMGGAGFATAVKAQPAKPVDTLIINAAECEPYLNCDNRLMIERTEQVIAGTRLLAKALSVSNVIIGIEANKMEAYNKLVGHEGITVGLLKKKYPQGAEKSLIYACTKRKVPCGGLPMDVGVVVNNVGTVYAIWDAVVNGRPLYKRVLTVSGRGVAEPKNLEVRVGTPLASVLEFCGGISENTVKLISGGPMMGFALTGTDLYTTKTDSGFLALTDKEASTLLPTPCINCGRCATVCPMKLMPMYIDFYTTVGDYASSVKYGAMNCIECGTCAYVCPAKRPIVQSVRLTKMKMREKK